MSTFRCEYVRCGKAGCRSCPHGPYWYEYWREEGKTRKRYWGKGDPRKSREESQRDAGATGGRWGPERAEGYHPHDAILNDRTATPSLAWEIMGIPAGSSLATLKARYRQLSLERHPDRGGSHIEYCRVQAAFAYLRNLLR